MTGRSLLRRLVLLVASLFVASFVIFSALYLAPGDPLAALTGGRSLPPSTILELQQRYHLDQPFLAQYWYYLDGLLHGDLGQSIPLRESVATAIDQRMWITLGLALYAAVIIVVIGVGLGIAAGLRPGLLDTGILVVSAISAAVPAFVAAIGLVLLFAVKLAWLPALGSGSGFADQVAHLTLPAIALALSAIGVIARITRASIREEIRREHVQTAISRGIPYRLVMRRHVLRNAAIPITTVTGITIASLIALSSVVETAFSLNGVGALLVTSAQSKDLATVQGIALVLVLAFAVVNLVVDVLHTLLDPRAAHSGDRA